MTAELIGAVLGAVVLLVVVTAVLGASRLRVLSSRIGSFVCGARPAVPRSTPAAPWTPGIAHYGAGRIDWWRSWSLAPRPARSWSRADLQVIGRAPLHGAGDADLVAVQCRYHGTDFELAMSPDAAAGLTAWLEAAPPTGLSHVI